MYMQRNISYHLIDIKLSQKILINLKIINQLIVLMIKSISLYNDLLYIKKNSNKLFLIMVNSC